MFAYRLLSGHWRVQTGVARTGEAGTVRWDGVAEQSSQGSASRSSAPGGGRVRRYPPEHLSFLTTTNIILPPPPQAWAV